MAGRIRKRVSRLIKSQQQKNNNEQQDTGQDAQGFFMELEANLNYITQRLGNSEDIITRTFFLGHSEIKLAAVYIDGLGDDQYIAEIIVGMLMRGMPVNGLINNSPSNIMKGMPGNIVDKIEGCLLPAGEIGRINNFKKIFKGLLAGGTILFIDGQDTALLIGTPLVQMRGVEEPKTEAVVRGSREGFTESLKTNVTLVRKILKNPALRIKSIVLGKHTNTKIIIAYIEGIADIQLVNEVTERVKRIEIDGILESGYIEQLIEDAPWSIFPTVGNSEKPDRVAANLLEGKVAVLTDGSPIVLILPWLLWDNMKFTEDYYSRPYTTSILRLIRFSLLFITTILPAAYVSLVSFHPEMIPTVLLITIAAAREGIPFPSMFEMLLMGLVFETLREAGVRLPRPVGQAVSIVGALVIGDIAVSAGLFSAPGVVATALTGIASFAVPSLTDAYIPIRLVTVIMSGLLGIYGLGLCMFVLLVHLCSLRSLGVPYLAPVVPSVYRSWKDIFIRAPLWMLDRRPLGKFNKQRMAPNMKPSPPAKEKEGDND